MNRAIAIALGVLLVLLALLLLSINGLLAVPFDTKVAVELHEETNPLFEAVMTGVSIVGALPVAILLTIIAGASLFLARWWLEAAITLATGTNLVVSSLLKMIVARERPMYDFRDARGFVQTFDGYSFPSGHVVFFMSFFGMLGYLAWRHFTGWVRWSAIGISALLIVLVGPSRVYLGAHWASDVVGGYIVGAIWLLILIFAYESAAKRFTGSRDEA